MYNNFARKYIDIECSSYENYRVASLDLVNHGYIFVGNFSIQRKLYDEMMEVDFLVKGLPYSLIEQRRLGSFANLVDEMSWKFKDYMEWDLLRLTGFENGKKCDDLVAFFVKNDIDDLAKKINVVAG